MSRPTKLTTQLQTDYLQALRSGCSRKDAAHFVGVHPDTVYRWLSLGAEERAKPVYREFYRLVQRTERGVKIRLAGIIQAAAAQGPNGWKAAAWWLERRYPDEFGLRSHVQLEADIQARLEEDEQLEILLEDEETRQLLESLAMKSATLGAHGTSDPTPPAQERLAGLSGGNGRHPGGDPSD